MLSKYRIESVESRQPIGHADFLRPRRLVTLLSLEDGKVFKVLLPSRVSCKPGDVVDLSDVELAAALQSRIPGA